jgi:hypothetical protein
LQQSAAPTKGFTLGTHQGFHPWTPQGALPLDPVIISNYNNLSMGNNIS